VIRPFIPALLVCLFVVGCARFHRETEIPEPLGAELLRELPFAGPSVKADVLYLLLAAEIAGHRGQYAQALDNYLQVAEKVPDAWVAERAVRIALYLKDYDKAGKAVALWLERAPDSPGAHKAALMLALQRQQVDVAVSHFLRLLQLAPATERAGVLLDVLRYMDRKVPKEVALAVMSQISHRFADSPEVLYAHAVLALRYGETRLALTQISRAVVLRPGWSKLRLMQSQLLAQLGETGKARDVLAELVEENPDNLQLRLLYAQLLLKQRQFPEAERELRTILKRQPDHPDALYAYALVNLHKGGEREAEKALHRLLKQSKWRTEAYYHLGRIALRRGNYRQAVEWFDQVGEGDLAFDAQANAVVALAELGRREEALRRLEQLKDRHPQRLLQLYLLQAEILTKIRDYPGAFDALSQALVEFPTHPDLLYARALVAEQMGNPQQTITDLRAALEKRPEDPNILNALGYTLLEYGGSLQEAGELLERAIRLKPDDAAVLDSYGWLQFKLGDYAKALAYLQKAYDRNPDLEIAVHLGEVYWALGRRDQARRIWRRALEQAGDDPRREKFAKHLRDRLKP